MPSPPQEFSQSFFHGTKADFKCGDLLSAGNDSNYEDGRKSKYVYFTSNLHVAVWGAELAKGEGPGRIYIVEPTGGFEDDPNVTDKKFPGNPTRSYRTGAPLRVMGEVQGWQGHSSEAVQARKRSIEALMHQGAKIIED